MINKTSESRPSECNLSKLLILPNLSGFVTIDIQGNSYVILNSIDKNFTIIYYWSSIILVYHVLKLIELYEL